MEENNIQKSNVALNEVLVKKLDTMSFDMKYYININASIGRSGEYPSIMNVNDVKDQHIN